MGVLILSKSDRNPFWNQCRAPVIEVTTAKRRQSAANDARYVLAV